MAGNARAFPAFLYLRKTLGDGREGIPFFQLTGRAQYDTLSVDDISATVITLAEERRIPHGNDGADRGGLLHFAFAGYAAARLRHHAERRAFERRACAARRSPFPFLISKTAASFNVSFPCLPNSPNATKAPIFVTFIFVILLFLWNFSFLPFLSLLKIVFVSGSSFS